MLPGTELKLRNLAAARSETPADTVGVIMKYLTDDDFWSMQPMEKALAFYLNNYVIEI